MSLDHSPSIVTDGLVLHLDAASPKSYPRTGASWYDRSPNENHATLVNSPTFNSDNGGSIVTNGINNSISSLYLSSVPLIDLTIQLWVYPTNIGSGSGYMAVFDTINRHLSLWIGNQYYGIGGTTNSYNGLFNWQNNNWVCITMLKSSNTGILLKNNYEVSTSFSAGSTFTNQLQFGSNPSGGSSFAGRYANIKLYNRALTRDEISKNFNAIKSRFNL